MRRKRSLRERKSIRFAFPTSLAEIESVCCVWRRGCFWTFLDLNK